MDRNFHSLVIHSLVWDESYGLFASNVHLGNSHGDAGRRTVESNVPPSALLARLNSYQRIVFLDL